nr:alpha,alpha-trehalase TreF [Tanticharoenia sakaeratensis]
MLQQPPSRTVSQADVPQDLRPPSIALGGLFDAIGADRLFPDAKTAADAIPDEAPSDLVRDWNTQKENPHFSLSEFVKQHLAIAPTKSVSYRHKADESIFDYISGMWDVLTRQPDTPVAYSSLLPLPYPYVVPGGRFSELYYWDSYFTMIGLYESQRVDLMRGMVKDMASLIDRYGHIPNGTRTYYLSRSEPAFFALMVDLLAQHDGQATYTTYLPELQREHDYWMDGAGDVAPGHAYRHVVRLSDGTLLNRHWDDMDSPRDESYPQDIATAARSGRPVKTVYRDLRAGSETGWDFSSRWLADGHDLASIHTTDLATIELNCLIAHLDQTLAHAYDLKGDGSRADLYLATAQARIAVIQRVFWDEKRRAFYDYDWKAGHLTDVLSSATVMPLFLRMATPDQARQVAQTVQDRLLHAGGLTATDHISGQQWDSPNGWAPEEWMAVKGFENYGNDTLAEDIAKRWMTRVIATYEKSGVLLEKYDVVSPVVSPTGGKGGGEYPMQIGFGWTNGTLLGLMNRFPKDADAVLRRNPIANEAPVMPLPPVDAYGAKSPEAQAAADAAALKAKATADKAAPGKAALGKAAQTSGGQGTNAAPPADAKPAPANAPAPAAAVAAPPSAPSPRTPGDATKPSEPAAPSGTTGTSHDAVPSTPNAPAGMSDGSAAPQH